MLFKNMIVIGCLFTAHAALADDGGFVGIKVNDISVTSNVTDASGQTVAQPVANPSLEVKITGGEAAKLAQILPADVTVLTGMYKHYPKWVRAYNADFRSLAIDAGNGKPAVLITCQAADINYDGISDSRPPKLKRYQDGVHCSVIVNPAGGDGGDIPVDYSFDPKKAVCGG